MAFTYPSTGRGRRSLRARKSARWSLPLLGLALLTPVVAAGAQAGLATIHAITVDTAGNASYALVIGSRLIEAEKQGSPCDGFSRDDQVAASYDRTTVILSKDSNVCRLIIRSSR